MYIKEINLIINKSYCGENKMKSNLKIKIILIVLGIFIVSSMSNNDNLNFNAGISIDFNFEGKMLKTSAVSGKIHIDNNWTAAESAGICTGLGIYSNPYVIEDLVIDGGGSGSCILIENSNVYFKIENCTLHNSGDEDYDAGIELKSVNNGLLINNCLNNGRNGILLSNYCKNNTISGNTANNNMVGISLISSYYNTISGNTADNNDYGIYLFICDSNIISGNTANNNTRTGIYIHVSDENDILGNTACYNNDNGLILSTSTYNTVSGNTANNNNHNGIYLIYSSSYNTVSGNTANYNGRPLVLCAGIYLYSSNFNTISRNTLIGNQECIRENEDCEGNKFSRNGECTYGQVDGIPGYNIYFMIGILPILVIIMSKKLKKS